MSKIVLLSFANKTYVKGLERLKAEAEESQFFDEIHAFTEKDFDKVFWEKYHHIMETYKRGYGYWIWKPYILCRMLDQIQDDDIVVYLDAGCGINTYQKKKFEWYIDNVRKSSCGLVAFYNGYIEEDWCKGDLLDYMQVRSNQKILKSEQVMSGIWLLRKNPISVQFAHAWRDVALNHFHLTDDSPSVSPNPTNFQENRHDQSVFSLLAKQMEGAIFLPSTEVEVAYHHRDLGHRTYRRYKNHLFLALREKNGVLYKRKGWLREHINHVLWDLLNWYDDKELEDPNKRQWKHKMASWIIKPLKSLP